MIKAISKEYCKGDLVQLMPYSDTCQLIMDTDEVILLKIGDKVYDRLEKRQKKTKEKSSKLKDILLEFITNSNGKTRQEINDYIYPMLNDEIPSMNNRVRASLTYLKKKGLIENSGSDTKSLWKKM